MADFDMTKFPTFDTPAPQEGFDMSKFPTFEPEESLLPLPDPTQVDMRDFQGTGLDPLGDILGSPVVNIIEDTEKLFKDSYSRGRITDSIGRHEYSYMRTGDKRHARDADELAASQPDEQTLNSVWEKFVGYTAENLPQMNPAIWAPEAVAKMKSALADHLNIFSEDETNIEKVKDLLTLANPTNLAQEAIGSLLEPIYFDAAAGNAFRELRLMKGPNGEEMPIEMAKAAAGGIGAFTMISEIGSDLLLARVFKAAGLDLAKPLQVAANRLFITKAYQDLGARFITAVGGNVVEEVAQQSVEIAMQELYKSASNETKGTDIGPRTFDQAFAEVKSVIEPAIYAGVGMTSAAAIGGKSYRIIQEDIANRKVIAEANNLESVLAQNKAAQQVDATQRVEFEEAIDEPGIFNDTYENLERRKTNAADDIIAATDETVEKTIDNLLYTKQGDRSAFSKRQHKVAKENLRLQRERKAELNRQKRGVALEVRESKLRSPERKALRAKQSNLLAEIRNTQIVIERSQNLVEQMVKPEFPASDKALIFATEGIKEAKKLGDQGFIEDGDVSADAHNAFKKELVVASREARKAATAGDREGERRGKQKVRDIIKRQMDKQNVALRRNQVSRKIANLISDAAKKSGKYTAEIQSFFSALKKVSHMPLERAQWTLRNKLEIQRPQEGEWSINVADQLEIDALRLRADAQGMSLKQLTDVFDNLKQLADEAVEQRDREVIFPALLRERTTQQVSSEIVGPRGTFTEQKKAYMAMTDLERKRLVIGKGPKKWLENRLQLLGNSMVASLHTFGESITGRSGVPYAQTKLRELFTTIVPERTQRELTYSWNKSFQLSFARAMGLKVIDSAGKYLSKETLSRRVRREMRKEADVHVEVLRDGTQHEMLLPEARKLWMAWQDESVNGGRARLEAQGYNTEDMTALEDSFSESDMWIIRAQFELYSAVYEQVNQIFSRLNGYNLPRIEMYSPLMTEGMVLGAAEGEKSSDMNMSAFLQDVTTMRPAKADNQSALQARGSIDRLAEVSDVEVMNSYLSEMAHYIAWADKIQDINATVRGPDFVTALDMRFGKETRVDITKTLYGQVEDLARGSTDFSRNVRYLDVIRTNFTVAQLGAKIMMAPKQLTSFAAYATGVNKLDFAEGIIEFLKHPKKSVDVMRALSSDIKLRGFDFDRDARDATRSNFGDTAAARWLFEARELKKMAMYPIKLGDKGAIYLGAYARMKALAKANPKATTQQLVLEVEDYTAETQQSAELARQSAAQRGGSYAKMFTSFVSTQLALQRKLISATRQLANGRISTAQWAETFVIYQVVIPSFFMFVANGFNWDEDDQKMAVIAGPWSGIPIMGKIIENIFRAWMDMDQYQGQPIAVYDAMEAVGEVMSGEADMRTAAKALNIVAPVPSLQLLNMIEGGKDITEGDVIMGILEIGGLSPYTTEKNYGDER